MLDAGALSWLLLVLGVVLGWVLAVKLRNDSRGRVSIEPESSSGMPLDNLSDDAVLAIIHAAEQQPALAELQLTLGAVFRRRGEVDRAIGIHQSLLSNTELGETLQSRAQYELARDFQQAGLMDRAEELLTRLIDSGVSTAPILETLLSIYEQARDWRPAIGVAEKLQAVQARDLGNILANYHCELSEQLLVEGDRPGAKRLARRALDINPRSVRASLMMGSMAEKEGDPIAALRAYRRVPAQDSRFIPEVLAPLERCAHAIGHPEMFLEFIEEAEEQYPPSGAIVKTRARLISENGGDAGHYLMSRLAQHPHWSGLLAWIEVQGARSAAEPDLAALRETLQHRLKARPAYQCTDCGLASNLLFWQCPSCKHWDAIRPSEDLL